METDDGDRFDLTGKIVIRARAPEFIGSYSVVYRGKWGESTVAVKVISPVGALSTMRRKVRRERTVWEALEHPNVLPFYGHADDEEFGPFGAFISPWCLNGDVGRFLEQYGGEMETAARFALWMRVLDGVAFLHSRSPVIVHGDLKPGNILIDDNRNPRICDFGLSRIIQEGGTSGMTTTTEHTGTERYLAPELVNANQPSLTTASDVYALGCLGLEFIYLQRPYAHRLNNYHGIIITDIREGIPPANRQDDVHSPMDVCWRGVRSWHLLEAFWSPDPVVRPAAASVAGFLATSNDSTDNTHIMRGIPVQRADTGAKIRDQSAWYQERDERLKRHRRRVEAVPSLLHNNFALDRADSSQQYTSSSRQLHPTSAATFDAGTRIFLSSRASLPSSSFTSLSPSPPSSPSTSPIRSPSSPSASPSLPPPASPSQDYPLRPHYLWADLVAPNPLLLAAQRAAPNERRMDRPLLRYPAKIVSAPRIPVMRPPHPNVRSSSSFQFTSRVENGSQIPEDGEARRVPKLKLPSSKGFTKPTSIKPLPPRPPPPY